MLDNFFQKCDGCRKKVFHAKQRSYTVPAISRQPVTSNGRLCRKCYRGIKNAIINKRI
jgi:hypothetical protein